MSFSSATHRIKLGWIAPFLWVAVAFVVVLTALMTMKAHVPIPITDEWPYLTSADILTSLLRPHNEHVIALPKLVFLLDILLARGSHIVSLSAILIVQAIHSLLLMSIAKRAGAPKECLILIPAGLFWAYPFSNFVVGFQVQFVGVFLLATLAFATLVSRSRFAVAGAYLWSLAATFTMANGVLVGLLLPIVAAMHGAERRAIAWLTAGALFNIGAYAACRIAGPAAAAEAGTPGIGGLETLPVYFGVYLGAPFARLLFRAGELSGTGLGVAALIGLAAAAAFAILLLRAFLSGELRRRPAGLALAALIVFLLASAAATAWGRSFDFPLSSAATGRYGTPALIFWVALFAFAAAFPLRDTPVLRWPVQAGAALLVLVMAASQPIILKSAMMSPNGATPPNAGSEGLYLLPDHLADRRLAVTALLAGVNDASAIRSVYSLDDGRFFARARDLQRAGLAPFDHPWTRLLGRSAAGIPIAERRDCPAGTQPPASLAEGGWRVGGILPGGNGGGGSHVLITAADHRVWGYGWRSADRSWADTLSGGNPQWLGHVRAGAPARLLAWRLAPGADARCLLGRLDL